MKNCTECDKEGTNQAAIETYPVILAWLGLGITSIIALVNFFVLVIILRSKPIRANRHHNLVLFLSISDLTLGVSGVLGCSRLLISVWSAAFIPCMMPVVLFVAAVFMSLFQTFLISFHRFLVAVGRSWNDRLLRGKRKYAIYFISWSGTLAWTFAFVSYTPRGVVKVCNVREIYGENFHIFSSVYSAVGMVLLISTIFLYVFTVNIVRKRYMKTFAWQMENKQSETRNPQTENSSDENKYYVTEVGKRKVFESLKVVGIIITLLVLCTGPFVIMMFMTVFNFRPSYSAVFVVVLLPCLNSVLNPFVYSWKIDPLRKEFKLFFRMCFRD